MVGGHVQDGYQINLRLDIRIMSDNFHDDRTLTILYATETGTAQDAANRIARHCRRVHVRAKVVNMSEYPLV